MNIGILSKRTTNFTAKMKYYYKKEGFNVKIYSKENLIINNSLIENDLFILKSKNLIFLYAGSFLEANKVPVIPNADISYKCKNRIEASFLLKALDLNTPQIFLGTLATMKDKLNKSCFPLILKPIMGSGSKGVKLINSFKDLKMDSNQIIYLEKLIVGTHYLVYFIDDNICVCEKKPLVTEHSPVKVIETSPDIRNIIFKWKEKYKILFGHLDIVRETSTNELYVVDPGTFPEFSNWKCKDDPLSKVCDLIIKRYMSIINK